MMVAAPPTKTSLIIQRLTEAQSPQSVSDLAREFECTEPLVYNAAKAHNLRAKLTHRPTGTLRIGLSHNRLRIHANSEVRALLKKLGITHSGRYVFGEMHGMFVILPRGRE
ncbi:MAG TPA: hypothetical protein VHQ47_08910 [Phycisphaerae bacterium]|nr:hypothetical protein [Phycisphaerae bacterium]